MMKLIKNLQPIFVIVILAMVAVGCSDDNDDLVITDPDVEFDGELIVTEAGTGDQRSVTVNASDIGENANIKVAYATTSENMRRLYVTRSIAGAAPEPYTLGISQAVDNKKDGSLDLNSASSNAFEFQILFEKPLLTDGTVVYQIWATTGRGDFRDISKRNAIGDTAVGTITIRYGSGVNEADGIKAFTATMLAAPLGDGSSETFISLFNNTVYRIDQGEEFAALWDFGYYFGVSNEASFASTSNYPSDIIDIAGLTGLPASEFNNFFFAKSTTQTTVTFDAVSVRADLDVVVTPTSERVTNLAIDDIVEFVDNYGNKGLLKVTNIVEGAGTSGSITFDVKVQL